MSEAIKIKEGGVDRSQNQINKLKTNTVGGGVCYWIPETELETDSKSITANGTYVAEDEGLYGYDEITVSVPETGSMSGKGADGNEYSVTIDENGYIVETELPYSIRIEVLPSITTYNDGDAIIYGGMVVKAYLKSGDVWTDATHPDGIIPLSELILPVTEADSDAPGGTSSSDLPSYPPSPIISADINDATFKYHFTGGRGAMTAIHTFEGDGKAVFAQVNASRIIIILANEDGSDVTQIQKHILDKTGEESITENVRVLDSQYTYNGKTAYYYDVEWSFPHELYDIVPQPMPVSGGHSVVTEDMVAWTALYGAAGSAIQTIPVMWMREDNKVLDDYFEISVHAAEGGTAHGNEGGGGFEGGGSEHSF